MVYICRPSSSAFVVCCWVRWPIEGHCNGCIVLCLVFGIWMEPQSWLVRCEDCGSDRLTICQWPTKKRMTCPTEGSRQATRRALLRRCAPAVVSSVCSAQRTASAANRSASAAATAASPVDRRTNCRATRHPLRSAFPVVGSQPCRRQRRRRLKQQQPCVVRCAPWRRGFADSTSSADPCPWLRPDRAARTCSRMFAGCGTSPPLPGFGTRHLKYVLIYVKKITFIRIRHTSLKQIQNRLPTYYDHKILPSHL